MTSSGQDSIIDDSMLDLFRMELENAAGVLDTGLADIESRQSSENIEPLMRAAHSVKGAARIVGIDPAVSLAGAMEDVLSAARQGEIRLSSGHIEVLEQGKDVFLRLSEGKTSELSKQLKKEEKKINTICEKLRKQLSARTEEKETKKPVPPPLQQKKASELNNDFADRSMLELFIIEVETHSRLLEEGLVEIESEQTPEKIEPLMRAAHSIKGAARIVNLNFEVSLAHAMEDVLSAAQHGKLKLTSEHIDVLLHCTDVFKCLTSLDISEITGALVAQSKTVKSLSQTLIDILEGKPYKEVRSVKLEVRSEELKVRKKKEIIPKEETYVRILSENLNRLIGLAGECLVQAKSSKPFFTSMLKMKNSQMELSGALEQLLITCQDGSDSENIHEKIFESSSQLDQIRDSLSHHIEDYELFSRRLENIADQLYGEVVASRMRPFSDGLHGFQRMVRDLARKLGKKVNFNIQGASTRVDRDILEKLESPLTHLLRNAIDHGLENPVERASMGKPDEGKLILEARHMFGMLNIILTDDGRGIDPEEIRKIIVRKGLISRDMAKNLSDSELYDFMFLPGFSTAEKVTELSGRGVGLDVVSAMLNTVGGSVKVESELGKSTSFYLQLPLTLSVLRTLLVEINGESYALPLTRIDHVLKIALQELKIVEDRQFCTLEDENIGIVNARQVLQIPASNKASPVYYIAIISDRMTRYGLVVDRLLGQHELVVRPLDNRLGKIPNISAGAIMEDGSPVLIMDVDDLVRSIDKLLSKGRIDKVGGKEEETVSIRKRILVVDDSITVREVERRLLENNGYEVLVAVDGIDGWNTLQSVPFDLVISDIDMPRMNGIELVSKIKSDPNLKKLPVMIISYKDKKEDKLQGLEAGADYYLTKASFYDESLLDGVRDLIGGP